MSPRQPTKHYESVRVPLDDLDDTANRLREQGREVVSVFTIVTIGTCAHMICILHRPSSR